MKKKNICFSLVFWIGDLNYRLDNVDIDVVKRHIQEGSYQRLMQHDQVIIHVLPGCKMMFLCVD